MPNERLKPPSLARYFFAIATSEAEIHRESEGLIAEELGSLDIRSEIVTFSDFSTYYDQEFGGQCWKYLIALKEPLPVDQIVRIKLFTEKIETELAQKTEGGRQRTVNIDPGFVTGWQVVLASVKIHSHRIYLDRGVYCELTLLYRDKAFQSFPWTYRDYQSPPFIDFLKRLRGEYVRRIQSSCKD